MNRRAQILSFDLVIALSLAALLWGGLVVAWTVTQSRTDDQTSADDLALRAMRTLDTLLLTPGIPTGWERGAQNQTRAVGLASEPHILSTTKVAALFAMEIDDAKELLNVRPLLMNITIKNTSGATLVSYGDSTNASDSRIVLRRPVIYNGTTQIFELTLHP